MVLRGRVCADRVEPKILDLHACLRGDGSDAVCRGTLVRPLEDAIYVDHAARPDSRERVAQVVERRVRQIEDDAVDRPDFLQDVAGAALARRDTVDPVCPDVRPEQRDRRGVHVRGMNDLGPTSLCDQDGVRAHARERIGDGFALKDEIGDPLAFRGEPGTEVRVGQIDSVAKAVFRVHRRCASFAPDYLDRSYPAFPLHPAVLHYDPERGIPPKDRPSDRLAIGLQLARNLQYRDVSDHVERARERPAKRLRHVDDVFVAPDGHESLPEFPLFRGKLEVHLCRRREEQTVSFPDDAEMLVQDAQIHQPPSDFFPPLPRHDDTPSSHGPRFRRPRLRVFGIGTLGASVFSTGPRPQAGGKQNRLPAILAL